MRTRVRGTGILPVSECLFPALRDENDCPPKNTESHGKRSIAEKAAARQCGMPF